MPNLYFALVYLTIFASVTNGYEIPREGLPLPAIKNAALEYKGPVFLIKETDDLNEPFIGLIVDGGIEMVRPIVRPVPVSRDNESAPEIQEDPEYFAVFVTPDTIAHAQISRTTTITIPLNVLLAGVATRPGVSSHMPWLMVLKKHNHFNYFQTLINNPNPIIIPQRRRYKRGTVLERGRLLSGDKNYDMLYTEDDKTNVHGMCTTIVRELMFLDELLRGSPNDNIEKDSYELNPLGSKIETRNETKVNESIEEEYAIGNEYKFERKFT